MSPVSCLQGTKSHSPSERHGTPRTRPTRTGRQQQGRAPNQDKRRLGARPAAAAVAGPEDEGATLYWLVIVNETLRWGVGRLMLLLAYRWTWPGPWTVAGLACSERMD